MERAVEVDQAVRKREKECRVLVTNLHSHTVSRVMKMCKTVGTSAFPRRCGVCFCRRALLCSALLCSALLCAGIIFFLYSARRTEQKINKEMATEREINLELVTERKQDGQKQQATETKRSEHCEHQVGRYIKGRSRRTLSAN